MKRFVCAKGDYFFLPFHDFRLLAHDFVVDSGLFGLSEDDHVSFRRILVSFPIFFRFHRPCFGLNGEHVMGEYYYLHNVRYDVSSNHANLHVFRNDFDLRRTGFVFAVVRCRRDVSFVCLLVFYGMSFIGMA